MARQWLDPATGTQFDEDGTEEFIVPVAGAQFQENQAAAGAANPKNPLGGIMLQGPLRRVVF